MSDPGRTPIDWDRVFDRAHRRVYRRLALVVAIAALSSLFLFSASNTARTKLANSESHGKNGKKAPAPKPGNKSPIRPEKPSRGTERKPGREKGGGNDGTSGVGPGECPKALSDSAAKAEEKPPLPNATGNGCPSEETKSGDESEAPGEEEEKKEEIGGNEQSPPPAEAGSKR